MYHRFAKSLKPSNRTVGAMASIPHASAIRRWNGSIFMSYRARYSIRQWHRTTRLKGSTGAELEIKASDQTSTRKNRATRRGASRPGRWKSWEEKMVGGQRYKFDGLVVGAMSFRVMS
jgi:hypothetical protein